MVYPYNGHPSWTNHRCKKLAQSFYAVVPGWDPKPRPLDRESDALPQHHDTTLRKGTFIISRLNAFSPVFCLYHTEPTVYMAVIPIRSMRTVTPKSTPDSLIRSACTVSTVSSHGLYGHARSPIQSLRSVVRSIQSVTMVTQKGINRAAE